MNFLICIWVTELNFFFLNMTQRIELFFWYDSKNWTHFSDMTQRIELFLLFQYDSTNWTLLKWTQRIGIFWMTLRTELFSYVRSKNCRLCSWTLLEELNPVNMTQKKAIYWIWLNELNFVIWLKELIFSICPKEILALSECDSKNWTFSVNVIHEMFFRKKLSTEPF